MNMLQRKSIRITRDLAERLVAERIQHATDGVKLKDLRLKLLEADVEVDLLKQERSRLVDREVELTLENAALRTEIEEVAVAILALNERLTALVRRPPADSEPVCWFQIFPSNVFDKDVLAVQTSNEHGDNWQFPIPLNKHNAVLLCHMLGKDGGIPADGVEVPQQWLYEALHEALDPIAGDGDGSVARAFLEWVDERVGVN